MVFTRHFTQRISHDSIGRKSHHFITWICLFCLLATPSAALSQQDEDVDRMLEAIEHMIRANPEKKVSSSEVLVKEINKYISASSDAAALAGSGDPSSLIPGLGMVTDAAGYYGLAFAAYEMSKAIAEESNSANAATLSALQNLLSWALGKMGNSGSAMAASANLHLLALNTLGETVAETTAARWNDSYDMWQRRNVWKPDDNFLNLVRESGWKGMFLKMDEFWETDAYSLKGESMMRGKERDLEIGMRNSFLRKTVFPRVASRLKDEALTARVRLGMQLEDALANAGLRCEVSATDQNGRPVPELVFRADGFKVKTSNKGRYFSLFLSLDTIIQSGWNSGKFTIHASLGDGSQGQSLTYTPAELERAVHKNRADMKGSYIHAFMFTLEDKDKPKYENKENIVQAEGSEKIEDSTKENEVQFDGVHFRKQERRYEDSGSLSVVWTEKNIDGQWVRHGVETAYLWGAPGKVEMVTPYENGVIHGTRTEYYVSGAKEYQQPYVESNGHGIWYWWGEDGTLYQETPMVDGNRLGTVKGWVLRAI